MTNKKKNTIKCAHFPVSYEIFCKEHFCPQYTHCKNTFIPVNVQWDTKTLTQCTGRYCEKWCHHTCFCSIWSKSVLLRVGTDLPQFVRELDKSGLKGQGYWGFFCAIFKQKVDWLDLFIMQIQYSSTVLRLKKGNLPNYRFWHNKLIFHRLFWIFSA